MSKQPWCHGSLKAVPGHDRWFRPESIVTCPSCGLRMKLHGGCLPKHRLRVCLAPGCEKPQSAGGLCADHAREIVGNAP